MPVLELRDIVARKELTGRIIWGAMLASVGLMVLFVYLLRHLPVPDRRVDPALVFALAFLALINSSIAFFLHRYRRSGKFLKAACRGSQERVRSELSRIMAPERAAQVSEEDLCALQAVSRGFSLLIINMALNDTVAVFGFVAAVVSGQPEIIWPFSILAVLLHMLMFPRLLQDFDRRRAADTPAPTA